MPKRNALPLKKALLTVARITDLQNFAADLAILCRKYRFELSGSRDSCELIEVYDATDAPLPDGFDFVGCFHHVDGEGIFDLHENGVTKTRVPSIEVCEWEQDVDEAEWSGPVDPPNSPPGRALKSPSKPKTGRRPK